MCTLMNEISHLSLQTDPMVFALQFDTGFYIISVLLKSTSCLDGIGNEWVFLDERWLVCYGID